MKINVLTQVHHGGPYNWGRILVSQLNNRGFEARHIHKLFQLLASPIHQNADIIHGSVLLGYRLWKKPLILTIHGEYPMEKENIWRHLYPSAIARADIITTPSFFLKDRLNLKDAIVIPNAVAAEQYRVIEHTRQDTINLLTVTSFGFEDKARGILDLLMILDNLPGEIRKKVKFSVVGGGTYLKQIEGEARKYKTYTKFLGRLPDIRSLLEESNIFLYFSHYDNFPLVILEAMASGLPVLTNDVGAINEMINREQDGFIASDQNAYVQYLVELINNVDLRRHIGSEAQKKVVAKFNWPRVVERYIEIYNRLA